MAPPPSPTSDGGLFVGERVDDQHQRTGERVEIDPDDLTTHGVIVGMTGSGKTGLGVALVEEALLQGIPTLVIDPKGDLGNLLLTFPDLSAGSFAPWVKGADPAEVATRWEEGLASWGLDGERIAALRAAADTTIYTPGSTSGVGLDVVGDLRRPAEGSDPEAVLDEVVGLVSGLLGLVGIESDPLSGREHILLTNLVQAAWDAGRDLDLAALVAQVQTPPIRTLGVFELDALYPPADRTELAMRLNGLLASPAFAAWAQGEPLDIEAMLRPGGRTGCAIVSLAHLDDDERQLVVTLLLSRLVTWMRRQPGTDRLRTLVYFDEVVGYVPPTAAPPAKAPILTLLKQARAFGVGLVLATQNPVDVDYRALSNAGTWLIGRLQTEQDKARLLDGLAGVGGVDTGALAGTIAGLAPREFVLRQAGRSQPSVLTTRWVMSYLRGPLTREQVATLMADRKAATATAPASTDQEGAPPASTATAAPATAATPPAADDGSTPVMPAVAEGTVVRWLDPAAPWAPTVGFVPTGTRLAAAVVATVDVLFDEAKADLRHTETFECVLFPLANGLDPGALVAVDHDPRDLRAEPPPGATYVLPDAAIGTKALFSSLRKGLVEHLVASRTLAIPVNRELRLYGRPGEDEAAFAVRCAAAADAGADAAAASLATRYEARIRRARDAVSAAEDRVAQAEAARGTRRTDEVVRGAADVLGSLLGGRRSARSIARAAGSAVTRRSRSGEADRRVESAQGRVDEKVRALADLEGDLRTALATVADEWDAKEAAVEVLEVPLERSDVRVRELALVWAPVA